MLVSSLSSLMVERCWKIAQQSGVERLRTRLGEGGRLYGLVNNAGGILSDARQTIQLNTYGPIRVCQAFIPLLQSDQGDKTNITDHRP